MDELTLQKKLIALLSDPSLRFKTREGQAIQILSIGEHNRHEGPDFLSSAILTSGNIIVGDIEYHKTEKDWINHGHSNDSNYENVILHIVSELATEPATEISTLHIPESDLLEAKTQHKSKNLPETYEDIQHFALVRLLRKASEAHKLIKEHNLQQAIVLQVVSFLERYGGRRRRPVYNDTQLDEMPEAISNSQAASLLVAVSSDHDIDVVSGLQSLIKTPLADEGDHLRRELVLNCILPLAICLAEDQCRLDLFVWFWSAESLHKYGILNRKFPGHSQKYLWQQQGLLEYQRMYGNKKNIIGESVKNYGFAKVLDFYKFGSSALKFLKTNSGESESVATSFESEISHEDESYDDFEISEFES